MQFRISKQGYNCAQSVFLAYSDIFELDMETAKKMSVSFGGGVGRMREICGTVSAMAMLAGFKYPVQDISDQEDPHQELCNGTENG